MNRVLLAVGLAALDVCWIYPWSLVAGAWSGAVSVLSPLTMLTLILLGAVTTHFTLRFLGRERAQAAIVVLAVFGALMAVRLEHYPTSGALDWLALLTQAIAEAIGRPTGPVVALLVALLLWRRGAQLGSSAPTFPDVEGAFRWSIGALIGFALVLALAVRPSQQPVVEARATPFVVGSFFVALLTLALARLESLRTRSQALALNTQWLGVLIAVAGLLVLLSLAVAQVLSFDLLLVATRPFFEVLGRVLLILLFLIVVPLAYVIQLLVYWLLQFLSPSPNRQPPQPPTDSEMEGFLERLLSIVPPEAIATLKVIGALLLLGVALLLVARTVARWRPRLSDSDTTYEERDSVYQPGTLWQMFMTWLRRLFGRADEVQPQTTGATSATASSTAATVLGVRELYRRLLAAGATAGAPRPIASTPYEHEPALQTALGAPAEVDAVTQAYVQVRYAEAEPAANAVQALSTSLERVLEVSERKP